MSVKLRSFLAAARRAWNNSSGAVTVVIGNESADADSIVSVIMHAYYLQSLNTNTNPSVVPVASCLRSDFKLRREAQWLLARCVTFDNEGNGDMLFLDEFSGAIEKLREKAAARCLKLTLVDHNAAWGPAASLGNAVHEIVDHHADAGAHPHVTLPLRCISFDVALMRGVGSTCTLVGARLLALHAARVAAERTPVLDKFMTELLVGVILLDTGNLNPAARKSTPEDERVVAELCALYDSLDGGSTPIDCKCVNRPACTYRKRTYDTTASDAPS